MIADLRGVKVELVCPRHHIDYLGLVQKGLHLVLRVGCYRLRAGADMPLEHLTRSQLLLFNVFLRVVKCDISNASPSLSNKLFK